MDSLTCTSFITKRDNYDRNHGPIPYLDEDTHLVEVNGFVKKRLRLSAADLRNNYAQNDVTCVLQCAGNRRHSMAVLMKEVPGIDWGDGAIMNCTWRGVWLRDILSDAGLDVKQGQEAHVAFSCYATKVEKVDWYGASIDLKRAMSKDADVLVALEMNGKALPRNHGYPVRIIIPGVAGCRSVKWLDRITIQHEESENFYQKFDYKILPPEAVDMEVAKSYWDKTPALQDMPLMSIIAIPQTGEVVERSAFGTVQVKGYAVPHSGQGPVTCVEVSADRGKTWKAARITAGGGKECKWSWAVWETEIYLKEGDGQRLLSRARDSGGNEQNQYPKWNLRGVAYDGYGESRELNVV